MKNTSKPSEAVIHTLIRSAYRGYAHSQNRLGDLFREGNGVAQDYAEAANWYRMAAEQGDPYAQNNLGSMYLNGLGLAQSSAEAVKWYRLAAEQGEPVAQYNLGVRYREGDGVPVDLEEAARWIKESALNGYLDAINDWGVMLKFGYGVRRNRVEAATQFVNAARRGDVVAMGNLTDMLEGLASLARRGNYRAAYALGMIYRYRLAGAKDNVLGAAWFRLALKIKPELRNSLGNEMYHLGKLLTEAQSRRAIEMAAAWVKDCVRCRRA